MVVARAGTTIDHARTDRYCDRRRYVPGFIRRPLFQQLGRDVLGVLLMALENLQAGLQQALELAHCWRTG